MHLDSIYQGNSTQKNYWRYRLQHAIWWRIYIIIWL
jgi:hypothetical protein